MSVCERERDSLCVFVSVCMSVVCDWREREFMCVCECVYECV